MPSASRSRSWPSAPPRRPGRAACSSLYPVAVAAIGGLVAGSPRQQRRGSRRGAADVKPCDVERGAHALRWSDLPGAHVHPAGHRCRPREASVSYIPDFVYQISKTAEVLLHWPPTESGSVRGSPAVRVVRVLPHGRGQPGDASRHPDHRLRLDFVPIIVIIGCQLLMVGRSARRHRGHGCDRDGRGVPPRTTRPDD